MSPIVLINSVSLQLNEALCVELLDISAVIERAVSL